MDKVQGKDDCSRIRTGGERSRERIGGEKRVGGPSISFEQRKD